MGTLVGHVAPGFGFLLIGLWHLFNHIKLHTLNPKSYTGSPWFPITPKFKYLELFLIMAASTASIAMEVFISPQNHQPLDSDLTIPSNHLHNLEHTSIFITFFIYAAFAVILDMQAVLQKYGLTQLLGAIAFGQHLLLFHFHYDYDHMGSPQGQYHLLLQLLVFVSLSTTLLAIGFPNSILVNFVRSLSIFFQGLWLIVMGFMLWTPGLIAKGCFMNDEDSHVVVRCSNHQALHRANSLVNIQFSWFVIFVTVFAFSFYLVLVRFYGEKGKVEVEEEYFSLGNNEDDLDSEDDDVESQKRTSLANYIELI